MIICSASPDRVLMVSETGRVKDATSLVSELPIYKHYRYWRKGHSTRAERLRRAFETGGLSGYIAEIRGIAATGGRKEQQ